MAKIRCDFVTNSSSSSFVITYKQFPELDKETIEKYPFLKSYIHIIEKNLLDGDRIATAEELDDYFINQYSWSQCDTLEKILEDDEGLLKHYNEHKDKIEKGFAIVFKRVDYNDEGISDVLSSLHDGVNFFVKNEN